MNLFVLISMNIINKFTCIYMISQVSQGVELSFKNFNSTFKFGLGGKCSHSSAIVVKLLHSLYPQFVAASSNFDSSNRKLIKQTHNHGENTSSKMKRILII